MSEHIPGAAAVMQLSVRVLGGGPAGAGRLNYKRLVDQGRHTRRQLLKAALGGAAGIALGAPARLLAAAQARGLALPPSSWPTSLFVVTAGGINVLARTGTGGVVLVDGGSAATSDAVLKAVASLPGRSGPTLFNTHWHPEQTGSNETLGKAGAQIIAQENTRLWLTTDVKWPWNGQTFKRLPKVAQPNKTFYTTASSSIRTSSTATCPTARTPTATSTCTSSGRTCWPWATWCRAGLATVDYITGGWIRRHGGRCPAVLLAVANEQTRIVPARGPVLSFADLKTQASMYATIYERLSTMLNKGRGPSEAVAAKPTKEFDAQMGNPDEFVRRSFESLWAYLSPDA
jgi:hypothetical protein